MKYSKEQIRELESTVGDRLEGLTRLKRKCITSPGPGDPPAVAEYMHHGVSRRLGMLVHTIASVFSEFPTTTTAKLERDVLMRVQANLHAFYINLVGTFDNFAWCYVHLHSLDVGGPLNVDMFKPKLQQRLPPDVSSYLASDETQNWHKNYLKNYRDALAHRIPMYVPSSAFVEDEGKRYKELEAQINEAIMSHEFDLVDRLRNEQDALGSPSFMFAHSFYEKGATGPLILHPQMLVDTATVIEFGNLFLDHWRTPPVPLSPP
ncbi:hypothetical protein [Pseudoxanthomonas sp. LH2527]|uniref:hypothetical protein n=1 Tax=Pseudoxanthomonas sp. LH2527 TaxID=2923249 RepID=UPI001F13ADD2|nr:hypothetical protein [Pseudoxanthomonas sp. LH2527]